MPHLGEGLACEACPNDTRLVAREQPPRKSKRRTADPTLIGTTLAGRYHLVRMLGDGGMGAVYKAADQVLRRFVAIKLLHPSTAKNPAAVERFVREARSAAAIGHPNIIDILDFGYEHGRPYLVMEYLRGRSVSEALAAEGPMSVATACSIATHSLAGLAAAHDRGILHRDLKPANMMLIALLGDSNFVKLCDFGFAALVVPTQRIDEGKTLTPARTLVGTPAYAAPERLRGDDRRDPRIDVYSLGVVLFEMLAGRRPFHAPTFRDLARKVRKEPPPALRAIRTEIPKALEQVVNKALSKDAKDRWSSAQEFASALVPFGGRFIPLEDIPSDSFTMDLLRIRARETQQQRIISADDAKELLELRRRHLAERDPAAKVPKVGAATRRPLSKPVGAKSAGGPKPVATKPVVTKPVATKPVATKPVATVPDAQAVVPAAPDATMIDATVADAAPPAHRCYAGAVALSVLRYVSHRFGERALTDLLATVPEGPRAIFETGIVPTEWVAYDAVNALIQHVDARLGRDDLHLVVQCGRAAAEGAFDLMRDVRPPAPPPEVLLAEMPAVLARLVQGVEISVGRLGRGYGRVEVDEGGESSLMFSVFLIGFLDRSLDRFGATDVEVSLISSAALGDPTGVYEISWIT
ncbi:MAG: protein kinase [Myxococcota bacterium]